MACTTCGSSAPCRCSSCTDTSSACCQNTVQATPQPYYNCAPPCVENHTQKIVLQQFYTTINIQDSWNIPACGATATISSIGLKSAIPGSYIWNETYGYFEITAFNITTGQITVLNHCDDGNAAVGTNVPACTEFVVTSPPCECPSTDLSCVAIDFTAPADGDCLDITITSLGTINAGDDIEIGGGRYYVDHIVSSTVINICNQGLGLTPGTAVIALDAAGGYQYCITVVESCCAKLDAVLLDVTSVAIIQDLGPLDTINSNNSVTPIVNASSSNSMLVSCTVVATSAFSTDGTGAIIEFTALLQQDVDGGGFSTVASQVFTDGRGGIDPNMDYPFQLVYGVTFTVLPLTTKTVTYRVVLTNDESISHLIADQLIVRLTGLGIAA